MINWNKKPYSQDEFREAWGKATFADDAACTLGISVSTGSMKTLNRIAEELELPTLPLWNKNFTPEEFTEAWNNSITVQEVAHKLNAANSRGFKELATILKLPEKADNTTVSYSKEAFISAWEECDHLDEVADFLEVSTSKQSLAKLLRVARSLGLPAKKIKIHTTDTGEDASAIIADWIDWHTAHYQVAPLDTQVKISARKVKELITAKYGTPSIKWGLFQWTLAVHRGYMDPNVITTMTHKHHLAHNPQAAAMAAALETQNEVSDNRQLTDNTRQAPVIEAKKW